MWQRLFRAAAAPASRPARTSGSPGAVLVGSETPEDPAVILRPMIGRRVWFRPLGPDDDPDPGDETRLGLYAADRDIRGTLLSVTAEEATVTFPVLAAPQMAGRGAGMSVLLRIPTDGGVYEALCRLRQIGGDEGEYFLRLGVPPEIFRLQRRSFVRVPCHLDAELHHEDWPAPRRARVINLSQGGVGLIVGMPPQPGDRFTVFIRGHGRGLKEAGLGLHGLGPLPVEVRRIDQNLRGLLEVGAIWVDIPDQQQQDLKRLLEVLDAMRQKEGSER